MNKIIATAKPESLEAALNEIFYIDSKCKIEKWLDKTVVLINLSDNFSNFVDQFNNKKIVFLQHIFPVCNSFEFTDTIHCIKQLENILSIDKDKSFSIQCRVAQDQNIKKFEIYEPLNEFLTANGFMQNTQSPQQIISIFIAQQTAYIGISLPTENISTWSGGHHRFAKYEEQISRAEFKLLEAIDYFNIPLNGGNALDLGAAPGGWSKVLTEKGFTVDAVDPANLDSTLKNVTHHKETAEVFLSKSKNTFDLIVNDMKMDIIDSVNIVGKFKPMLKQNGYVIMTLKLPKKNIQKNVNKAIKIAESMYNVVGVRQLFHNRSEVTLILQKS